MDEAGAIARFRAEQWKKRRWNTLSVVAVIAVLFDMVTTYHALITDGYSETNLVLVKLAEIHVAVALFVHAGFAFSIVAVSWHSFGWLSTTTGWFAVVALGGAGVDNLLGVITDASLSTLIPGESAIVPHVILPLAGFLIGALFAYRNYWKLPLREVVAVGTALLSGTVLPLLLL